MHRLGRWDLDSLSTSVLALSCCTALARECSSGTGGLVWILVFTAALLWWCLLCTSCSAFSSKPCVISRVSCELFPFIGFHTPDGFFGFFWSKKAWNNWNLPRFALVLLSRTWAPSRLVFVCSEYPLGFAERLLKFGELFCESLSSFFCFYQQDWEYGHRSVSNACPHLPAACESARKMSMEETW